MRGDHAGSRSSRVRRTSSGSSVRRHGQSSAFSQAQKSSPSRYSCLRLLKVPFGGASPAVDRSPPARNSRSFRKPAAVSVGLRVLAKLIEATVAEACARSGDGVICVEVVKDLLSGGVEAVEIEAKEADGARLGAGCDGAATRQTRARPCCATSMRGSDEIRCRASRGCSGLSMPSRQLVTKRCTR